MRSSDEVKIVYMTRMLNPNAKYCAPSPYETHRLVLGDRTIHFENGEVSMITYCDSDGKVVGTVYP